MTDVPDIVDVFFGTPLGTSDHCFVSWVLRVEQSVPEYNIWSTVFLKHRTNWDNDRCAVRSFTWSTILKWADPLDAFDRAIGEVMEGLFQPLFCVVDLAISNGLVPAAGELIMLSRLLMMPGVEHARSADRWLRFVFARPEALRVYGAARESHNERTKNILKCSTCSHKWWESLKLMARSLE